MLFIYLCIYLFIGKTDPSNPLERELYWRHILQTNAFHRVNLADSA